MDLSKNGKLLCELRKSKGLTQKQLAEKLSVVAKTVSKWETGRGFPDISLLSKLAEVLGVSEKTLISGDIVKNVKDSGNIKKTKFFVCKHCGSFMQTTGNIKAICCGKTLEPLTEQEINEEHKLTVSQIENDFYIEFNHEMTKSHFISFVAFISYDRVLTIKLYPEQNPVVRIPKTRMGKLVYCCNNHGLFSYQLKSQK